MGRRGGTFKGRAWALGFIVVVFAGASFAAAQTPTGDTVPEIRVPLGHVADRVTYEVYERRAADASWEPVAPESFVMSGSGTAVDATGRPREAVHVTWLPAEETDPPLGVAVDLRTREVLRYDTWRADRPPWTFVSESGVTGTERYAVHSTYGWQSGETARRALGTTMFWMQGESLALGDDRTSLTETAFRALLGPDGALVEAFRFEVTAAGWLGDEAVVAVRLGAHLPTQENRPSDHVPLSGQGLAPPLSFTRTAWYASSSAYPLMVEDRVRTEDGRGSHTMRVLATVEERGAPIPWETWSDPGRTDPPAVVEMTTGALPHPGPGSPHAPCLPLEEVLERLASDPEHADLRAWQAVHAPNHLVGIQAECVGELARWWILFATPAGEAFGAVLETGPGAGDPSLDNEWLVGRRDQAGAVTAPTFDAAALPDRFVTLAHAARLWENFRSGEDSGRGFERLSWGFTFTGASWPDAFGGAADWSRIALSRTSTENDEEGRPFTNATAFHVDVRSGAVVSSDQTHYRDVPVGPTELVGHVGGPASPPGVRASAAAQPTVDVPLVMAIATGSLAAALVLTYLVSLFKLTFGHPWPVLRGYAKIDRERLLDNDHRAELLRLIHEAPGLSATEIARDVRAGWSTIIYHLRVLERNGYIASSRDTRHRRFFAVRDVPPEQRQVMAVLRNERTRHVLELVRSEPGIALGTLAHRIGVTPPGVAWHVRRLEAQALVVRRKVGRTVHIEPAVHVT